MPPMNRRPGALAARPAATRHAATLLLLLGTSLPLAAPVAGQTLRPGLMVGRLLTPQGEPIGEAVLRATRGPRTIVAYSEDDGDYRLGGLAAGTWTISVRRLGFAPRVIEVDLPAEGLRRDLTLEPRAPALDSELVAEGWVGVRGVVGDARRESPLSGAVVVLLGADASTNSDSVGRFALKMPRGRPAVLRVERAGFLTRLVSTTVPDGGYADVDIGLDTALKAPLDAWLFRDLNQRLKYATPRAAFVGFEELQLTGMPSLWSALEHSQTIIRKTIVISRSACIFVNGIPKPGVPVDAIFTANVEFVEVYPPGSELTRTLQRSWPLQGECGARGGLNVRAANPRQTAQIISVWERTP